MYKKIKRKYQHKFVLVSAACLRTIAHVPRISLVLALAYFRHLESQESKKKKNKEICGTPAAVHKFSSTIRRRCFQYF